MADIKALPEMNQNLLNNIGSVFGKPLGKLWQIYAAKFIWFQKGKNFPFDQPYNPWYPRIGPNVVGGFGSGHDEAFGITIEDSMNPYTYPKERTRHILWDRYGIVQGIATQLSDWMFTGKWKVTVPDNILQDWINNEMFGKLRFKEKMKQAAFYGIITGDMLAVEILDIKTKQPNFKFITDLYTIPTDFSCGETRECVWAYWDYNVDGDLLIAVRDYQNYRELYLFQVNQDIISPIKYGADGTVTLTQALEPYAISKWGTANASQKFCFIAMGANNIQWLDTPFHQGICFPIELIRKIEWAWDFLNDEVEASKKLYFVDKQMVEVDSYIIDNATKQIDNRIQKTLSRYNLQDVYMPSSMRDEIFKEIAPAIRIDVLNQYIKMLYQQLGQVLNLGPSTITPILGKNEGIQTATQVVMASKESYTWVRGKLDNCVYATKMLILAAADELINLKIIKPEQKPTFEQIKIDAPLAVYMDPQVEFNKDLQVMTTGAMPLPMFYERNYGIEPTGQDMQRILLGLSNPTLYIQGTANKEQLSKMQEALIGRLTPQIQATGTTAGKGLTGSQTKQEAQEKGGKNITK